MVGETWKAVWSFLLKLNVHMTYANLTRGCMFSKNVCWAYQIFSGMFMSLFVVAANSEQ